MSGSAPKPLLKGFRFPVIEDIKHHIMLPIQNHRDVLVALLKRGLVNPDVLQRLFSPACKPPFDCSLLNTGHLIPANPNVSATAEIEASFSQPITSASNRAVNLAFASAHATGSCFTPCSSQRARGTSHSISVFSCIVSRWRHLRS